MQKDLNAMQTNKARAELMMDLLLVAFLIGFDVAARLLPHAYGFLYHQIMGDRPPPSVPILMNTFYPPTQPSIGCAPSRSLRIKRR